MTFFETAVELLHLLTDEADGEDRDLLDDGVSVVNVLRYLLDDPRPSIPGEFDAANCCNDLDEVMSTLAAALLMNFSWSIMVLRTRSLKAGRLVAGKDCHRYSPLFWIEIGLTLILMATKRRVPAEYRI